jgi:hypothetical protein
VDTDGVPDECQASVLFVNANGGSLRGGTNWANAYTELVDALAVASNPANAVSEIWVAAGTYKPDKGSGDRSATFQLLTGLAVFGGFAGTETLLTERDPGVNLTILDGDISTPADSSDNTYQVVDASGTDATAVLDGVVIRNGNADGETPLNRGGGLHIDNGTPTIRNCRFEDNHAGARGGALYNEFGTGALVSQCTFEGNTSPLGGAVYVREASPVLANCAFRANSATVRGGALHVVSNAAPLLVNCTFAGNTSPLGGALSNNSGATAANCTFTENSASNRGGGVFQTSGGASLTLENSVLWNNSDASGTDETGQLTIANGSSTVRYSCIQNYSAAGVDGNIAFDPLFVDADGPDNTAGTADDDLRLQAGSPAIDAGDNGAVPVGVTTDLNGIPRFINDPDTTDTGNGTAPIVDMGAFEFFVGCPSTCGDIDGTGGNIDLVDFASFAVCFNALPSSSPSCACSDLNLDGTINLIDFATFALLFNGSTTQSPPNCTASR